MSFWFYTFMLLGFGIVSFVQNMAFTWSSRSRNSGDPDYHRKASWASNGIYYITNALLTVFIVKTQVWWMLGIQGFVYTLTTAEGSVLMMKKLIAKEKGKRKVGSQQFSEAEVETIRTRTLMLDNGDGVGTFTLEEIGVLKSMIVRDSDAARTNLEEAFAEIAAEPGQGDLQGYGPDLRKAEDTSYGQSVFGSKGPMNG